MAKRRIIPAGCKLQVPVSSDVDAKLAKVAKAIGVSQAAVCRYMLEFAIADQKHFGEWWAERFAAAAREVLNGGK